MAGAGIASAGPCAAANATASWNPPRIEGRLVDAAPPHPDEPAHRAALVRATPRSRASRATPRDPWPPRRSSASSSPACCRPSPSPTASTSRPSGRLIGLTTFSSLDPDNGSVLFHITIGERDAWGQGYGTEATELMLWLAFERIGPAPRRPDGVRVQRARHPQLREGRLPRRGSAARGDRARRPVLGRGPDGHPARRVAGDAGDAGRRGDGQRVAKEAT